MTTEATCAEIRAFHRARVYAMEQRKRADLSLGSFLRIQLGWVRDGDSATNERARSLAADMIDYAERRASKKPLAKPDGYDAWAQLIEATVESRAPWDAIEKQTTKEMERLAKTLPVWDAWAAGVRGFGAVSLATIVGEAGDLSNYANPGKLWKRMGLALVDGVRQGGLSKNAPKEAWIAHGYNKKRRSRMFVVGDVLVKVGADYRDIYLDRKEYERAQAEAAGKTVKPAARIKDREAADCMSDGHVHRRAQRYMEKKLLRDLWVAWRANEGLKPMREVPAKPSAQAGGKTIAVLKPKQTVSSREYFAAAQAIASAIPQPPKTSGECAAPK